MIAIVTMQTRNLELNAARVRVARDRQEMLVAAFERTVCHHTVPLEGDRPSLPDSQLVILSVGINDDFLWAAEAVASWQEKHPDSSILVIAPPLLWNRFTCDTTMEARSPRILENELLAWVRERIPK